MTTDIDFPGDAFHTSPFDRIKHMDEAGEFWLARELGPEMGYRGRNAWKNIMVVINKVRAMIVVLGGEPADHVAEVGNMIEAGKGAIREVIDFRMTRRGCYVFAECADERKIEVAAAKNYFIVRARSDELRPKPTVINQMSPWAKRFRESYMKHFCYVRRSFRPADFSMVIGLLGEFLTMEDVLLEHGFELFTSDRPDISVAAHFGKWVNSQPPVGKAPLYLPNTDRDVEVKVWPGCIYPEFMGWYKENYIPDKLRSYVLAKYKRKYGEIPADSATNHFSKVITERDCPKIPPRNLRIIERNGGMVRANQSLVGCFDQKQLGFFDHSI